jgi:uncharacterized protein YndB with AHSA1/START domain
MTNMKRTASSPYAATRRLVLKRTYQASLAMVWEMWTTPQGIEEWWGPNGFDVKVRKLDLRPGGKLLYAMTATAPAQVDFVKGAGIPVTVEMHITYTEVAPQRRLAFMHRADFIPGVPPYDVATAVDLYPSPSDRGMRMVLTFDAMHDEEWTRRTVMGWQSELGKLAKLLGT